MYSLLCIPDSGFTPPARGAGDFSTGIMGIIAPALTDGGNPYAALVQATDGNFFGTTFSGGANACPDPVGCGTVFRITPTGALTLYSFCFQSGCTDGEFPFAGLAQATNGKL
jgi:uncharacterized repeat protein (TIGR03803 family)